MTICARTICILVHNKKLNVLTRYNKIATCKVTAHLESPKTNPSSGATWWLEISIKNGSHPTKLNIDNAHTITQLDWYDFIMFGTPAATSDSSFRFIHKSKSHDIILVKTASGNISISVPSADFCGQLRDAIFSVMCHGHSTGEK